MGKGQSFVVVGIVLTVLICLYKFTLEKGQVNFAIGSNNGKDGTYRDMQSNENIVINRASSSTRLTTSKTTGKPLLPVKNSETGTRLHGGVLENLRKQLQDQKTGRFDLSDLLKNANSLKSNFLEDILSDGVFDGNSAREDTESAINDTTKSRGYDVNEREHSSMGGNLPPKPMQKSKSSGVRKDSDIPPMIQQTSRSDSLSQKGSSSESSFNFDESLASSSEDGPLPEDGPFPEDGLLQEDRPSSKDKEKEINYERKPVLLKQGRRKSKLSLIGLNDGTGKNAKTGGQRDTVRGGNQQRGRPKPGGGLKSSWKFKLK